MELDLQSFFWLHVRSCTLWLRPRNSPPPCSFGFTRALLVSQDRRHLFVTLYLNIRAAGFSSFFSAFCIQLANSSSQKEASESGRRKSIKHCYPKGSQDTLTKYTVHASHIPYVIKGSLTRDFQLQVFLMNQFTPDVYPIRAISNFTHWPGGNLSMKKAEVENLVSDSL
jgi:hypothetical protein